MDNNNYIQRPRPYPYYNTGNYRQFSGLTSGINMLEGNAVSSGWESMVNSMLDVQKTEYADEELRQEKFKNLIEVSLKDVRGQWRDEAVTKKEAFLGKATKLASESQGKLTWDQEKQLMVEKEGLEQFAGMSQEVTDWYNKAVMTASQMTGDPEAQRRSFDNIKKVMATPGGLAKVHKATQDPSWLETTEYTLPDALALIETKYDSNGKPDRESYRKQAKSLKDTNNPKIKPQIDYYNDNVGSTGPYPTFEDWMADQKYIRTTSVPRDKVTYVDKTKPTKPDIQVMKVKQNINGDYIVADYKGEGGVKIGAQNVGGVTYQNAKIIAHTYDDEGNEVVRITHSIPNEAITEFKAATKRGYLRKARKANKKATEEQIQKIAQEKYDRWVVIKLQPLIRDSKDQTIEMTSDLPWQEMKQVYERHITETANTSVYSVNGTEYSGVEFFRNVKNSELKKKADDPSYVMKTDSEIYTAIKQYFVREH